MFPPWQTICRTFAPPPSGPIRLPISWAFPTTLVICTFTDKVAPPSWTQTPFPSPILPCNFTVLKWPSLSSAVTTLLAVPSLCPCLRPYWIWPKNLQIWGYDVLSCSDPSYALPTSQCHRKSCGTCLKSVTPSCTTSAMWSPTSNSGHTTGSGMSQSISGLGMASTQIRQRAAANTSGQSVSRPSMLSAISKVGWRFAFHHPSMCSCCHCHLERGGYHLQKFYIILLSFQFPLFIFFAFILLRLYILYFI